MSVKLRQRLKNNKISLYLDYYKKGERQYEYLQLYLHPDPIKGSLSREQKEQNRSNLKLAESIRSKRHLEIQNGLHGFNDLGKLEGNFIGYMAVLAEGKKENKNDSKANYQNWDSALNHLKKFNKSDEIAFRQIDARWLEKFKHYLQHEAKTKSGNSLSDNSQHSYFNKVRAAIREAHREGILTGNPSEQVTGIKPGEPQREFLSYAELKSMAKAECEIPVLKTAFLFSALTGLRWSDVNKLIWSEVRHSKELGHYISFRQKKTRAVENQPISADAAKLLGERGEPNDRVFSTLKYSSWHNLKLQQWAMKAGISKTISFHCARHTYAVLQLTFGTDIYTVSKLLGHRELKTTQIYAKVIDEKKKAAAGKIKLKL